MKVVSCNVQGAKKPQLQLEVGFINRTIRPGILILVETMVNEHNADLIIKTLGFSHYERIPTDNHCSGIWCLWNSINVDVTIIAKESRAIHCHVIHNVNNKQCMLIAIYAPGRSGHKDVFWRHLKQLNELINLPWCLIGDFNELLQFSDKVGVAPPTIPRSRRPNDFWITRKALMPMSKDEHSL